MRTCPICLSDATDDYCRIACGHAFHARCIKRWISDHPEDRRASCPVCRTPVAVGTLTLLRASAEPLSPTPPQGQDPPFFAFFGPGAGDPKWLTVSTAYIVGLLALLYLIALTQPSASLF